MELTLIAGELRMGFRGLKKDGNLLRDLPSSWMRSQRFKGRFLGLLGGLEIL